MPHLTLLAMSGFRVREPEMLALGMRLPGLAQRASAIGALPSLGLLTLAGMTPPHWSISLHEAPSPCDEAACDRLVQAVVRERPTLVAMSALTASILDAYALVDRLRREGVRVVIGGLHATACPEEAGLHADAVVVGDGEPEWQDVLRDAEQGMLQPVYRARHPFDLAEAPLPRFGLLSGHDRPRFTLQTARGCPLACEFCGASRTLGPFREKPVRRIEAELEAITALQPRAHVELADDNTFAGRRDPGALLDVLGRSGARWFTECDWRIGEKPEVLEPLAAAGCVQMLVGVESLSMGFSGMGAKRAPLSRVMAALGRIQDAGVAVIGCFVLGGDDETLESIHALSEWLLDAPLADVQLTLQTPFPGTALRARLQREGRLLRDRGWEACTLFDVAYQPRNMSPSELERAFRNAVAMVFAGEPTSRRAEIRRSVWARRYGSTPSSQPAS